MPRQNNVSVQNKFFKGLVTEATGLTFPEDAATDADNVIFDHLGGVYRRKGFDLEDGYSAYSTDTQGKAIVTYLWKNVAGDGDKTFTVVQIGDDLHFYNVSSELPLSEGKHPQVISLTAFAPVGADTVATLECQFSSGNGVLFVTGRRVESFYIKYDALLDVFTPIVIDVRYRDFEGDKADSLGEGERPTSTYAGLSSSHKYNLFNQGWTEDTLSAWDTARADMPSNSDVSWYFKDADNKFDFTTVDDRSIGNSPAPGGHYIYNVYNTQRSGYVAGATDYSVILDRLTTSAFYAGRVFYAGIPASPQSSRIYFSQIIEDESQYGKCYQVNDPTSEKLFDLLPSDGGMIDILDAGQILKMIPVLSTLIVICTNGVWLITGSQGVGFTANDYSVQQISKLVNLSHTSFIDVEGLPYWWSIDGIYTLDIDKQSNSFRVTSVTDQTIREYFLQIPSESIKYARGVYDAYSKKIHWIYKSRLANDLTDRYNFDRILTINLISKSFFPWSFTVDKVNVKSIAVVFAQGGAVVSGNVVVGTDYVVDGVDRIVSSSFATNAIATNIVKYFVGFQDGGIPQVTWAEIYKDTYRDWETLTDSVSDYDSYFVTGYVVRGGGFRKFQENYINVVSDTEIQTAFRIQGRWDYATSSDTNRWSVPQNFDIRPSGYAYRHNKIKIRGHGKACQFKIYNNGTMPFHVVGWSVAETANQWI